MSQMTAMSKDGLKHRVVILALSMVFVLTLSPGVRSQTTIILNTADVPPDSTPDLTGIGDSVVREAFKRIGVAMRIVRLPSERALFNANEGIDDGNYARIKEIDKFYPNLIQIPESLLEFEFVAFSKRSHVRLTGWDSLRPYNVGIVRGWKILEENITGAKSLAKVKNEIILFDLLNSDKVDVIVYDQKQGLALLKKLKYRDIRILRPPLVVREMYLHLHKKHKDLVPLLTDALRGMKKDGTYTTIVNQALDAYLTKGSVE